MKRRDAIAEIRIDRDQGWVLPTFGSTNPHKYWGHAHFEGDSSWPKELWTLIVELSGPPDISSETVRATIHFLSEDAPQWLIEENAKFDLSCERNFYTSGVVKQILPDKPSARMIFS